MKYALIVIALCGFASATNAVFLGPAAAGGNTGLDCSDAKIYTYFNTAGNWNASPTGIQIGPDTTVHLCAGTYTGTLSTVMLTFQGSGSSGHPITLFWETGATLSNPACPGGGVTGGCVNTGNQTWLVINGNNTTNSIQNTANGTSGHFAHQVDSDGIGAHACNNCIFENLDIEGIYVMTPPNDNAPSAFSHDPSGIYIDGSNYTITNVTVNNSDHGITSAYVNGDTGITLSFLTFNNFNQGISYGNNNTNVLSNVLIHDIHLQNMSTWDNTSDDYHHDGIFLFQDNPAGAINNVQVWNLLADGDMGVNATAWIFYNTGIHGFYVFNSKFFNTAARGVRLIEGGFGGDTNYFVVNNYIDCGGTTDGATGMAYSNGGTGTVTGFTSENNAFHNCGIYMDIGPGITISPGTINHNVYESSCNGSTCFHWNGSGGTFSAWKTACSCDAASLVPVSSGANSAGVPQSGSAMIHDGTTNFPNLTSLGVTPLDTDYAGTVRPSVGSLNWDAGAYQFASLTPASSPTCSLTAGTYQGVQYPPCTNPNSGTTIQCYTLDGSTPITNGSGTACTHGTALPSGNYVPITVTETLKLVAGTSINSDSSVTSYFYTIKPPTFLEITAISAPVIAGQTNFTAFTVVQGLNSPFLTSQTPALSGGTTTGTNPLAIDQEVGTGACSPSYTAWTTIDGIVANYRQTSFGVQPASEGNGSTATSACVFSQAQANASALTWTASTAYLPAEYILASGNYWQIQVGCFSGSGYDNTCTSGLTLPNFTGAGPVTDGTVVWVKIGVNAPLQDAYCGAGHTCGGCNVSNPGVILNLNSVGTYTCPATSVLLTSTQLYNGQPIPYELPNRNWYNQIITQFFTHYNGNPAIGHVRFGSPMGFENGGLGLIVWPYIGSGTAQLRAQYISWINKFYAFIMSNQPTVKVLANINSGAVSGSADPLYADQEAILANKYGMWGIGNEDFTILDMADLQGVGPTNCVFPLVPSNCTQGDWAYNFATFPNLVHELQTLTGSTPINCTLAAGLTGPLFTISSLAGFTFCPAGTIGLLPFLVTTRSVGVGSPLQKIWVNIYESDVTGAACTTNCPQTHQAGDVLLSLSPNYAGVVNTEPAYAPYTFSNLQAFAQFLGLSLTPTGPNSPYFLGESEWIQDIRGNE